MRPCRTKVALTALVLVGALVSAGCSSDGSAGSEADGGGSDEAGPNGIQELDPDQILTEVSDAVGAATSVHLVGEQSQGGVPLEIDLQMTAAGDAAGTITNEGVAIELILVDGATYFRAPEDFWISQLGPELAASVGGKFVEVPAGDESIGDFGDFNAFFADLLKAEGGVEKGAESTVNEIPALILIDKGDEGELYVSMQGEPLPLKVVSTEQEGELQLLDWNEAVDVEAPAEDEIVDLSTLAP